MVVTLEFMGELKSLKAPMRFDAMFGVAAFGFDSVDSVDSVEDGENMSLIC